MTLGAFLTLLRRRWAWVVTAVVVGVGLMDVASVTATRTYTATASVFFSLEFGNSASDLAQGSNYTQGQVASYALLARTPTVLGPVIEQQHLATSVRTLAGQLATSVVPDTVIVQLSVTDSSPARAAAIANAVARQLGTTVEGLAPVSGAGKPAVEATTVATADEPRHPVTPRTTLNLLVGLVGGVLVGALAALARDVTDTRVRSAEGVAAVTRLPVLASLDTPPTPAGHRALVVNTAPRSVEAESFRALRTAVGFARRPGRPLVLLVTSATPAEGKSTVAANLALALTEAGSRTVLVDADLRRPSVASTFRLEGDAGLTSVLIGEAELADVLQPWGTKGLDVLTSGPLPPNPSELLSSPAMSALIAELGADHDAVVIDTAPALAVTDSAVLAPVASGVVLVGAVSMLRRNHLRQVLELLDRSDGRVIGLVLTHVRRQRTDVYAYDLEQSVTTERRSGTGAGAGRAGAGVFRSKLRAALTRGTTVP